MSVPIWEAVKNYLAIFSSKGVPTHVGEKKNGEKTRKKLFFWRISRTEQERGDYLERENTFFCGEEKRSRMRMDEGKVSVG